MKLSLIIPAYNEEERISSVIRDYKTLSDELIIVADGDDRTAEIARKAGARVLDFDKRLGKGGAVIEGFKVARFDILGFVDSDGSVSPTDFKNLIKTMETKEADVVIGSRRVEGSRITRHQPRERRIMSHIFNLCVNLLFSLKLPDTQCGAKIFKKECINKVIPHMKSTGFEFDVELLWRLREIGCRIEQSPISWSHKEGSKFSLMHGPKMLLSLIKIRLGL